MLWPISSLDGLECADLGVLALNATPPDSLLFLAMWVGMFFAADRLVESLKLLPLVPRPALTLRVHPRYEPPLGVLLAWNVFTAMSVVSAVLTARSHLAIVFKTLHVASEAALFMLVLAAFQLRVFAASVLITTAFVAAIVVIYPCDVAIQWAELAGLLFDSLNFVLHLVVGARQRDNARLWATIRGLGMHAVYLALYLVVNDMKRLFGIEVPDDLKALLRVAGLLLNVWAVQVFLSLARATLLPPSGVMTLAEWRASQRKAPRALWKDSDALVLEDAADGALVPLHEPHRTAYAVVGRSIVAAARPGDLTTSARVSDDERHYDIYAYLFRVRQQQKESGAPEPERVYVRSLAARDLVGTALSVVAGVVFWVLR
jgi:hypothetical protein